MRLPRDVRGATLGAVVAAIVSLLTSVGCAHTVPFRDAHSHLIPGSIAALETVSVGGIPQRLWFRGINTANPALLILHGGPGASEAALFRHFNVDLEHHFLVVNWEQ